MVQSHSCYDFGDFRLDARERILLRDGQPVPLTPKTFEMLFLLVSQNGRVVEKDQLMNALWPETFVDEANLSQNVFALRKILGEKPNDPKYIETVPRRGYRFVASVSEVVETTLPPSAPAVHPIHGSQVGGIHGSSSSLAVLPFINNSADSKLEYLSDGITESIINSLSQLRSLRVKSRSAVFRYKGKELDAQRIGRDLGVDAVLIGRVQTAEGRLLISTELVDAANGWQLWGEHYDCGSQAIFEVQEEIAKQISATLRLRLTGDDEQRITKRYTESTEAYQAYLEGRYHWSEHTSDGLTQAIEYFRQAITLDPNYALAYAGIVDCYLRLATKYIPPADVQRNPADAMPQLETQRGGDVPESQAFQELVKLRYEWDTRAAEREIKRAAELKSHYPATHQWYAAYLFSKGLYDEAIGETQAAREADSVADFESSSTFESNLLRRIQSSEPTQGELVHVFCTIAREQIDAGNYEAACAVLQQWWTLGEWPSLEGLGAHSSADLLFTTGCLAGWVAGTKQMPRGQKHAEALLNGAIGIFEQLGAKSRSAEGRIELGFCHYREGSFDLARISLLAALDGLGDEYIELRSVGLIRLASLERHAGRLREALKRLEEVAETARLAGSWAIGRYHLELATTLKNLAIAETRNEYADRALDHYEKALYEFEAIGKHRHTAIVENNHGYLLLTLKRFDEAEPHLERARKLFDAFGDTVRRAQVDDTLAQLHIAAGRFDLGGEAALRAVQTLELGGEEALVAEALTTQGVVLCRLGRHREAKRVLDRAHAVAERCGDSEGAGRALLIMIEEMCEQLDDDERLELGAKLDQLLGHSQQASILDRLKKCLGVIAKAHARYDKQRRKQIQRQKDVHP